MHPEPSVLVLSAGAGQSSDSVVLTEGADSHMYCVVEETS